MNDNQSEPSKPLGYREQTYSDFVRAWVNAKKEEQRRHQEELEAERQREQAKLALQERAREIERAREVERTREVERMREIERIRLHEADVPARVIEAQDLLVPQLAYFEAELAEPTFLQLRGAREAAELDPWLRRGDLHWSVYVVLLSRFIRGEPGGRKGKLSMPHVYVGQTWHDPEYRFKQHKELVPGYPSRHVRDYGIALLPEVYSPYNPLTREMAPAIEAALADALHQLGCTVYGGH